MKKEKLVTLLCPCYNAEKYIETFIESIINQTYKKVQIIFIDDGSTDRTSQIIEKSREKFKQFNEFLFLKKENGGAGSAINYALKFVKGKYLCWADCDDYLEKDNIKDKVHFLDNNDDYALVLCGVTIYDFNTKEKLRDIDMSEIMKYEDIFDRLIYPGVPCYPGVFMIRTNKLFDKLKDKQIAYNKRVGQNWQLLLPVAYKEKCGYINRSLYKYYIRDDSHSHKTDYNEEMIRFDVQIEMLNKILNFIVDDEKKYIMNKIEKNYLLKKMTLAFNNNNLNDYKTNYLEYKKKYFDIKIKEKIKYIIISNKLFNKIFRFIRR